MYLVTFIIHLLWISLKSNDIFFHIDIAYQKQNQMHILLFYCAYKS